MCILQERINTNFCCERDREWSIKRPKVSLPVKLLLAWGSLKKDPTGRLPSSRIGPWDTISSDVN